MSGWLIGVDVGTGSARAGVFDAGGTLLGLAEAPTETRRQGPDRFEQDSEEVWRAVCAAVRGATAEAGARPGAVAAIAFDATCSLVARGPDGAQIGVGDGGDRWDTLLWLDHRAIAEAAAFDADGDAWTALCGGAVSPEMQGPKALWLKRRAPRAWARLGLLLDLPDFLSWRASGSTARSLCALACKWPWRGGWRDGLLARVGLGDLRARGGLPAAGAAPGARLGGLTAAAAAELGLAPSTAVAAGLIDAHAAALGMVGGDPAGGLALIAGTSSCVMALRADAAPGPGLWGPHRDAVLPGLDVIEGGQSAAGALLDHVLARFGGLAPDAATHEAVAGRIAALRDAEGPAFAAGLHVLPDFHGARAPAAAPAALGAIAGLGLDHDFDGVCRLYWRTCVALAVELREIVEAVAGAPAEAATLHFAGGHARNGLLRDLYAEALGCALVPHGPREAALRGAAAAAATAAGLAPDLRAAAARMARPGPRRAADPARARAWDRDLAALRLMRRHRAALAAL